VGNECDTSFWNDLWLGNSRLAEQFPRLFNLSQDKASSIANMGIWDSLNWIWNFKWRRSLRLREINLFNSLLGLLSKVVLSKETNDRLIWKPNWIGCTLSSLCGLLSPTCRSSNFISFKCVWKGIVPPKMEVFCRLAIWVESTLEGSCH